MSILLMIPHDRTKLPRGVARGETDWNHMARMRVSFPVCNIPNDWHTRVDAMFNARPHQQHVLHENATFPLFLLLLFLFLFLFLLLLYLFSKLYVGIRKKKREGRLDSRLSNEALHHMPGTSY